MRTLLEAPAAGAASGPRQSRSAPRSCLQHSPRYIPQASHRLRAVMPLEVAARLCPGAWGEAAEARAIPRRGFRGPDSCSGFWIPFSDFRCNFLNFGVTFPTSGCIVPFKAPFSTCQLEFDIDIHHSFYMFLGHVGTVSALMFSASNSSNYLKMLLEA